MSERRPFRKRRLQMKSMRDLAGTTPVISPSIAVTLEDPRRRTNLVLGVVVAITSVAMAVTAVMQWLTMRTQTKQNDTVIKQMRAEQEILKQQNTQTDAVIQQMRLEQRAWLGVVQPRFPEELEGGEPVSFVIPVKNSGRTPGTLEAANVHVITRPIGTDVGPLFKEVTPQALFVNQQTSIAPDATHNFEGQSPEKLGADVFAALTGSNRTRVLYLVGSLRYEDVMAEKRWTQFCFAYNPVSKYLVACEKYNFMN